MVEVTRLARWGWKLTALTAVVVVGVSLVGAPLTMVEWQQGYDVTVEPVSEHEIPGNERVLAHENLSADARTTFTRGLRDEDGQFTVYGADQRPTTFAQQNVAHAPAITYVRASGATYRVSVTGSSVIPIWYWIMESPFVVYGIGLWLVADWTVRSDRSTLPVLITAGVGAGFHRIGPEFGFPVVRPAVFAALGVVATLVAPLVCVVLGPGWPGQKFLASRNGGTDETGDAESTTNAASFDDDF